MSYVINEFTYLNFKMHESLQNCTGDDVESQPRRGVTGELSDDATFTHYDDIMVVSQIIHVYYLLFYALLL